MCALFLLAVLFLKFQSVLFFDLSSASLYSSQMFSFALCVCLFVYLSVSVCLSVSLSVSLSISLKWCRRYRSEPSK